MSKNNEKYIMGCIFLVLLIMVGMAFVTSAKFAALEEQVANLEEEIVLKYVGLENNTVSPGEMYQHVEEIFAETWNKYQVDPSNFDWGLSSHIGRVEQRMDDIYMWQMDMIRCIEDVGVQTLEGLNPCIRQVNDARYCVMYQDGCTDANLYMKQVLGWEDKGGQDE